MKKIVLSFLLTLVLALPVFAVEAPLLINATIDDGTGVGDEDDITVDGLKIRLAYQLDGNAPSVWAVAFNSNRLTADNTVKRINADLVHDDASSALCDSLYLLVGLSGNTTKDTSATISFAIPGWYEGTEGVVDGASPVTQLSLTGSSAVVDESSGDLISSSLGAVGSNGGGGNKAIIVTQNAGLESTVKLVGYSHIEWDMTQTVTAGDYSTTITVTVSEGA
ncbi:MAG: hypothetical protein IAC42_09480 [Spirochaetes bacterium]|uniref:WxL domain-containing protein n=1 Tax=Candidatus Aphodenecus pullistercoris TaxID=2840669 RepID=A0A9D9E9T2_9SPIR|nr:hypothetical protein [Candidatus Aphodenecus pullistercoris]